MENRLIPLNAWLALLTGAGNWPTPLRNSGLSLHRLETTISTSLTSVVVDGLAFGREAKIIVPTEAKSGANVEEDQARKYAAMTYEDISRVHSLPFGRDPAVVVPLYACLEQHCDRIRLGLSTLGFDWSLLIVSDERVRLEASHRSSLVAFDVDVPSGPPPRMVPVDALSPESEYQELLLAGVVAAAARRLGVVAVDTLLDEQLPYWGTYAGRTKREIRRKAVGVLRRLASGAYRDDFLIEGASGNVEGHIVRILRTPAAFDPRGETQGWQQWRRKGQRQLRRRPKPAPPGQMSFEDLGSQVDE